MPQPKLIDKGTSYCFSWDEYKLDCTVSGVREHRDGRMTCIVLFTTSDSEYNPHLLEQNFNLLGTSQAKTLLKNALLKVYQVKVDWDEVIGQICAITLNILRQGEPIHEIWTDDKVYPLEYKLYPILPEGEPTLLFADGGSGKSSIGLFLACCIALPWQDNPLGFKPKYGKPLYLDWETNRSTFTRRISWVRRGHNLPEFALSYRRCSLPLSDDMNAIYAIVKENQFDMLIIDSVIGAAKGNVNDSEVAQDFFRAVRRLDVTSLIIHHTAKQTVGSKSPFGSAYFSNEARSVWELSKQQEPGDNKLSIMLSHYKSNDDTRHQPIGVDVMFDKIEGKTTFSKANIEDTAEFQGKLSLRKRIHNTLKSDALSLKDIVDVLGVPYQQVANTLGKMKKEGEALRLPDSRWALPVKSDGL